MRIVYSIDYTFIYSCLYIYVWVFEPRSVANIFLLRCYFSNKSKKASLSCCIYLFNHFGFFFYICKFPNLLPPPRMTPACVAWLLNFIISPVTVSGHLYVVHVHMGCGATKSNTMYRVRTGSQRWVQAMLSSSSAQMNLYIFAFQFLI